MLTDFENSFTFENRKKTIRNKYNNSRHFLKTSLHYRVKYKSLKCCNCCTNPWWQSRVELLW